MQPFIMNIMTNTAYEFIKDPLKYLRFMNTPLINGKLSYDVIINFLKNVNVVYDNETIYFMDENEEYKVVKKSELFTLIKHYLQMFPVDGTSMNITNQIFNNIILNMQCLSADSLSLELERYISTPEGEKYKITNNDDFKLIHVQNGIINMQLGYENRHIMMKEDPCYREVMPDAIPTNHLLFLKKPYNVDYKPMNICEIENSPYAEPYDIMFPDKETRNVFFMCAGMILFAPFTWKMLPILYGPPHTGKSVIGMVFNAILSDEYMSAKTLNSLTSTYGLSNADKYILNLVPEGGSSKDASMSSTQCGIVKTLTGGDNVDIERKYKDSYTTRPTMKLMITTNHLPQFPPDEDGILARLFMFPLMIPYPFTEQMKKNPNYVPEMTRSPEALNWFFNRAMKGYFDLCDYTHNNLESLRTPFMLECMDDYRRGDEFTAWSDEKFGGMTLTQIQGEIVGKTNKEMWFSFEEFLDDEWGKAPKLSRVGFGRKLCNTYNLGTWPVRDPMTGEVVKKYFTKTEVDERKKASRARAKSYEGFERDTI